MSFNVAELTADLTAALAAAGSAPGPAAGPTLAAAIAVAIQKQVVTNAVVVPTALIAPAGGGPVTGVGNIT